jgi:TldD protein
MSRNSKEKRRDDLPKHKIIGYGSSIQYQESCITTNSLTPREIGLYLCMDTELRTLVQDILKDAEKKFPYAVASIFRNRGSEINLEKKEERLSSARSKFGFVLSLFNGEYFEEFATDNLEKNHITKFCRSAIDEIAVKDIKYEITSDSCGNRSFKTEERVDPDSLSISEKIDIFRHRRAQILAGKNVINCRIVYSDELSNKEIINSRGILTEELRHIAHSLLVYVSNGRVLKYDYLSVGGTGGFELTRISENDIDQLIANANRLLEAEKIQPDVYDIVATPEISGLIAHEAFGHGVETDMYLKDRARSREYLGKVIASPLVSIVDDPTLQGGYGSYFIDDEGFQAQPTYIIKKGRFVQGLTNRYASSVLNLPPTANGRRESFARKVYTRMSNTFFEPGTTTPSEIIGSVANGIYLIKGLSGMEDPKGWGIQVLVLYGKEIRKGKLTGRIFSPLGITGFVPELLSNISMVGNDFKVDLGICGKGYKEYIPVSSGGPHIKTRVRIG